MGWFLGLMGGVVDRSRSRGEVDSLVVVLG